MTKLETIVKILFVERDKFPFLNSSTVAWPIVTSFIIEMFAELRPSTYVAELRR
jgi:hypothetical protein